MISHIRGRVAAVGADSVILDVGGIGLTLACTAPTLAGVTLGEIAQLESSLVVREDSLTLYGFADTDERTVFEILQTVSGIGPRIALAVLAVHPPDALRRAVASEDVAALTRVSGIGRKGAERIIIELRDRLGPAAPSSSTTNTDWSTQVRGGLLALGWGPREADAAIAELASDVGPDADVGSLLRAALQVLDRS